jgi:AAA15 family ATPase/GTPase
MKITIKNCLAFQESIEIELNKWNLFIGANNSGKSSLLKIMDLLRSNSWHRDLFDVKDGALQWQIGQYSDYLCFENLLNDQSDLEDILLTFENMIGGSRFKLFVNISKSEFLYADGGLNPEKLGSEISSLKITLDESVLYELNNEHLVLNSSEILDSMIMLSVVDKEFADKAIDLKSKGGLRDLFLNVEYLEGSPYESMVILFRYGGLQIFNSDVLRFLNFVTRELTREVLSITRIDGLKETNLDQGSMYWASSILRSNFNLDLIYKQLYFFENDVKRSVGYNWVLNQNGRNRMLNSFGEGTNYLLKAIKQLANFKEEKHDYDNSSFVQYNSSLAIVEPERNLHPDWQIEFVRVLLNDVFAKANHILIETHSLHILKAIQVEVAKGNIDNNSVTVHEFYRDKDIVKVNPIKFDHNGFLMNNGYWRGEFNALLLNLERELWSIQQSRIQEN